MGRGNVSVRVPYVGLCYVDNGTYHVCRRGGRSAEESSVQLMGDLSCADRRREKPGGQFTRLPLPKSV